MKHRVTNADRASKDTIIWTYGLDIDIQLAAFFTGAWEALLGLLWAPGNKGDRSPDLDVWPAISNSRDAKAVRIPASGITKLAKTGSVSLAFLDFERDLCRLLLFGSFLEARLPTK